MKTHILLLSLLSLTGHIAFAAVDVGRQTSATPFDKYMGPVRAVHARSGSNSPTLDEVRADFRTARRFQYYFNAAEPYIPQSPAVTEARQQGDCKAKSVWLASKMLDRNTRYVVGKAKLGSKISHAWLLWPNGGEWLFLDPTMEGDVISADQVAGRKLIMRFSYRGSTAYAHPTYSQYIRD